MRQAIEVESILTVGTGADARPIARSVREGAAPTLLWLGGYRSDMRGTKAERLADLAAREGLGFCRFDYSGHGASGGRFEEGTISRWLEETLCVVESLRAGPLLVVGSSMGAWIALRLVQRLRGTPAGRPVAGLVLLAPAPDFTERLVRPRLTADARARLERDGVLREPSRYGDEPDLYTAALLEDGAANLVMEGTIETGCPVHIVQGMEDPDVPFSHALELVTHLPADGVTVTLVKDGDHRLSRPTDLALIERIVLAEVAALRQA
ncbi:alpha/beta hydrolase [Aurantimonas sp. Leaf443]|uniref:alpha/beta hydrolase n=1 Tax=Aurantimonas sp. Leaf443 TaxID=1736378 RepID=UPI0006F46638|nr:alpha/beta hydrolase [Aurantimonas sp. Leaf443]KQT83146.1 2-hydroxymuconic semialdehyde hydrolase [Aurantimonas sp. Leaf443]